MDEASRDKSCSAETERTVEYHFAETRSLREPGQKYAGVTTRTDGDTPMPFHTDPEPGAPSRRREPGTPVPDRPYFLPELLSPQPVRTAARPKSPAFVGCDLLKNHPCEVRVPRQGILASHRPRAVGSVGNNSTQSPRLPHTEKSTRRPSLVRIASDRPRSPSAQPEPSRQRSGCGRTSHSRRGYPTVPPVGPPRPR